MNIDSKLTHSGLQLVMFLSQQWEEIDLTIDVFDNDLIINTLLFCNIAKD
jgi:hypothetical protein